MALLGAMARTWGLPLSQLLALHLVSLAVMSGLAAGIEARARARFVKALEQHKLKQE